MHRALALSIVLSAGAASADDALSKTAIAPRAPDQGIGGELGVAAGGDFTPGGVRVAGHYLYQLSSRDWFDGVASFTYGGDGMGCYVDRASAMQCEHGVTAGSGLEIAAMVRRMFAAQGAFQPFARAGLGLGVARYKADDVMGFVIPVHAGAGLRARVSPTLAIVAAADLTFGIGAYSDDLGAEPLFGMAVTAGAEFDLR